VLAHQPQVVADSILWPGAALLLAAALPVIDLPQELVSRAAGTAGLMLYMTRKFNVPMASGRR
jgi:hypothetical protein